VRAELVWLDPTALAANPNNTNIRTGEPDDLAELIASIKAVGVLQALTVTPDNGSYRLLAGHRRTAAAIRAGEALVPCLVRPDLADMPSRIAAQLIENDRRSAICHRGTPGQVNSAA
jgi:ParB/RepB/Spo0J family partition protein